MHDERDRADRFSRDVDRLLQPGRPPDRAPLPGGPDEAREYREALAVAARLARADFSPDSRGREALRRRLLNGVDAREAWGSRKEKLMNSLFSKQYLALRLAVLAAGALLLVALAWPGALPAVAQGIQDIVQRIVLGPNSEVMRREFQPGQNAPPLDTSEAPGWFVTTDIGGFGGNVPPGADATIRSAASLDEARALAAFPLRAPGYLPEGYTLREAKLVLAQAFLFYAGPGRDIVIIQTSVGPQPGDQPGVAVESMTGAVTNGTLEEVELNGQPAAWVGGNTLMWEADGVSYTLGGLDLSLEEATRIAESLE